MTFRKHLGKNKFLFVLLAILILLLILRESHSIGWIFIGGVAIINIFSWIAVIARYRKMKKYSI